MPDPSQSSRALDLDALLAEVEGPTPPTLAELRDPRLWPPPLRSPYFVQIDADVASARELAPTLAGRGIGLSSNVDTMLGTGWGRRRPALQRLLVDQVRKGRLVYVDSGAYPRFASRTPRPLPDFDRVIGVYERLLAAAQRPEALAVTAPDAIGDRRLTRDLQRRYARPLRALLGSGVRLVVPVQGRRASELEESMAQIERAFPGAWIGVPVRGRNTTPLRDLVLALVRLGRSAEARGITPPLLPKLHLLGLGGSERAEGYAARISAVYRILRGPKIYDILRARRPALPGLLALMGVRESVDEQVAGWLVEAPVAELARLVGCVQTRAHFPCPPPGGPGRQTMEGHPAIDDNLRLLWRELGGQGLSAAALQAHPQVGPFVRAGLSFWTHRVLGRDDVAVDWHGLVERHGDWTELCIEAIEAAEQSDPCMVPDAWGADDLAHLVRGAGLARVEMDSSTPSRAAMNGRWIVGGRQTAAPRWWLELGRPYQFTWNLLLLAWDRWEREQRLRYEFPVGYDDRGFTTTLSAKLALAGRPRLLRALSSR